MSTKQQPKKIIWKSSGVHLTKKDENGWLMVTPDLLRAYYARPEVHPDENSCSIEHSIFERLMENPEIEISHQDITKISDADAGENYRIILGFRNHLLEHGTLEQAYLALFNQDRPIIIPPIFIGHMVHLILSAMLENEQDPFILRAAEILFREQSVTNEEGQIILADKEAVELYSQTGGLGGLGSLLAEAGTIHSQVTLDVLTLENKNSYWPRADQFNFALDYRYTEPGPDALARVLEKWVFHMIGIEVRIQAMQSIKDEQWSWHIGLDAQSSKILNDLYEKNSEGEAAINNLAGLFRLEFINKEDVIETMQGKVVYLGLAMSDNQNINMKPQNLLVNLPLKQSN